MPVDVRIHRVLISPDDREKVELFSPHHGTYGFRLWQRKRNAWRQVSEVRDFKSYARTVVEAARQVTWLGRALASESDGRLTYHLELLRGHSFRFATYIEEKFGDHDHCSACWAKFAERDSPDLLHQGFVARYEIPDGSGNYQWNWLCEKCFSDLRADMQWRTSEDRN